MGVVWRGRLHGEHGFEKRVAIKTIRPEVAADERFRSMLIDEARIVAQIEHPNVVQVFDVGEIDGVLFVAMEWVDGMSLQQLCRRVEAKDETMPLALALRITVDVCNALDAVHELTKDGVSLELVHRDVSPHNVLVAETGAVKLIDFGIAKARERVSDETHPGVVKGKPGYIAPEQLSGKRVDKRCDLWATGAVLYRMMAGAPPFETVDTLADFVFDTAEIPALPRGAPKAVEQLLIRALAREPSARFATAAEMRTAIEESKESLASTKDVANLVRGLGPSRPPAGSVPLVSETKPTTTAFDEGSASTALASVEPTRVEKTAPLANPRIEGTPSLAQPKKGLGLPQLFAIGALVVGVAGLVRLLSPPRSDPDRGVPSQNNLGPSEAPSASGGTMGVSAQHNPSPFEAPSQALMVPSIEAAVSAPTATTKPVIAPAASAAPPRVFAVGDAVWVDGDRAYVVSADAAAGRYRTRKVGSSWSEPTTFKETETSASELKPRTPPSETFAVGDRVWDEQIGPRSCAWASTQHQAWCAATIARVINPEQYIIAYDVADAGAGGARRLVEVGALRRQ
jgi:serine/threonine-protein kinase